MNRLLGHPGGLLGVCRVYLSVPCECQASPLSWVLPRVCNRLTQGQLFSRREECRDQVSVMVKSIEVSVERSPGPGPSPRTSPKSLRRNFMGWMRECTPSHLRITKVNSSQQRHKGCCGQLPVRDPIL